MKKRRVIKSSSFQAKSPVGTGLLWYLVLEHFQAPGWAYGVAGCILALWLFSFIVDFFITDEADVPGFGEK
jgi:hypothetical protein